MERKNLAKATSLIEQLTKTEKAIELFNCIQKPRRIKFSGKDGEEGDVDVAITRKDVDNESEDGPMEKIFLQMVQCLHVKKDKLEAQIKDL